MRRAEKMFWLSRGALGAVFWALAGGFTAFGVEVEKENSASTSPKAESGGNVSTSEETTPLPQPTKPLQDSSGEGASQSKKKPASKARPASKRKKSQPSAAGDQHISINLDRGDSGIDISLDPYLSDVYLDLQWTALPDKKGQEPQEEDQDEQEQELENKVDDLMAALQETKQRKETRSTPPEVINVIHKAQKLFYAKQYSEALEKVQSANAEEPTGMGYALEGSIYFATGDVPSALKSWGEAIDLDPEMKEVEEILKMYKEKQ
ncbi:MAG: hypothetical protein HY547_02715 [Elusimicrobia bacterium]|nr:hypothetical protein [Elusimicrobiota bacterium]